jgi:hypothetical protein
VISLWADADRSRQAGGQFLQNVKGRLHGHDVVSRNATMAPRNVSQTMSQRDSSSDMVIPELKT